jgi:hypothetical protein
MSETTTQNESTTPRFSNIRYEKRQAPPVQSAASDSKTNSCGSLEESAGDYVRAYRTGGRSISVSYNADEIHARSVRRELSKILAS